MVLFGIKSSRKDLRTVITAMILSPKRFLLMLIQFLPDGKLKVGLQIGFRGMSGKKILAEISEIIFMKEDTVVIFRVS